MKEVFNDDKYITQDTLDKCFFMGEVKSVDKVICGNGFSTAFINSEVPKGKVNIIIVPNRAVIMSKELSYKENPTKNKIKFFYKGSTDTGSDIFDANVLMFVADSFLLMASSFELKRDFINWVLIDEFHSVEIQSSFRYMLVDFKNKVKNIVGNKVALTTVTATPNLFSKVDIVIKNKFIPELKINVVNDFERTIRNAKKLIKENEKVLICTNNKNVIYSLRDKDNSLKADYIIGNGLASSVVELVKIEQDNDSNLKIVSSRGFEGFDIIGEGYTVFFFENRDSFQDFETFYISNLYQAINRTRQGAKNIYYCRKEVENARLNPFNNIDKEIDFFVNRKDLSVEQKQKLKFDVYKKFVIFSQNKDEFSDNYGEFTLSKNEASISLFKETLVYDKPFPSKEFKTFLEERKITLIDNRVAQKKLKDIKLKEVYKEDRLLINTKFIDDLDLFGSDYILTPFYSEDIKGYYNQLKQYLRRKHYSKEREMSFREVKALELFSDKKQFTSLLDNLTKAYNSRSIEKYGVKISKPYRDIFKKKSIHILSKLILIFANEKIEVPSKWVVNRDYNIMTEMGVDEIKLIAEVFRVEVTEVDVNSAFIRIIYALNGLYLPHNFYGENKENKRAINILLNNFFYDEAKKTPKRIQKARARESFKRYGLDELAIDYLIDNFFECKFRGNLFNFLSFYEKTLVSKVKRMALEDFKTEGVARRHDSLLLFNNESNLERLNHLDFLNRDGWFKIGKKVDDDVVYFEDWVAKNLV